MKRSVYCSFFLYDWDDLTDTAARPGLVALFDERMHEKATALASAWSRHGFDDGSARHGLQQVGMRDSI